MNQLTILGGSSPFTVELINELSVQNTRPHRLVLHGRNARNLNLVAEYARNRLKPFGWNIVASTDLTAVLRGADIVLHQIRYGDMSGRADDESFAQRMNIAADETLGPAALRRALLLRQPLKYFCEHMARLCPDAWVINLTNPLSLVTSLMSEYGITRCVGLCELPEATAQAAIRQIGLSPETGKWLYAGLNHRGFVVGLRDHQTDDASALFSLIRQKQFAEIAGFPTAVIQSLQAIPTKYFHLMLGTGAPAAGRAAILTELRNTLLNELESSPEKSPMSLDQRNMDWYRISVVPVLNSLLGAGDGIHAVNLTEPDGITRETCATVSSGQITVHRCTQIPPQALDWITRYEAHEIALLELLKKPSINAMKNALSLDPLVPEESVNRITRELANECQLN